MYSGPFNCFTTVLKKEGFRGLYRGWPPNVVFVMPEKALKLTMNDYFRSRFTEHLSDQYRRGLRDSASLTLGYEMAAGGLAGLCQVVMTNPMELLKIQGSLAQDRLKRGEITRFPGYVSLAKSLQLSGLYTGIISTLSRDIPFSMIYFALYSRSKQWLTEKSQLPGSSINSDHVAFLAGAIAGTTAAAVTCPVDVVKTRVHAAAVPQPMSFGAFFEREFSLITQTVSTLSKNEGAGAFFKGIAPRCLIISPLFAITMSVYEVLQRRFG